MVHVLLHQDRNLLQHLAMVPQELVFFFCSWVMYFYPMKQHLPKYRSYLSLIMMFLLLIRLILNYFIIMLTPVYHFDLRNLHQHMDMVPHVHFSNDDNLEGYLGSMNPMVAF